MTRGGLLRRAAVAAVAVAVVGSGVGSGASAAGPRPASAPPTEAVTILLKAPHPQALHRLASVQGLSHAQRVRALSALLPTAATHRQVVDALTAHGFAVTHQTAWTVDAAAGATAVDAWFGAPARPDGRVSSGVLPRRPAAIAPVTALVLAHDGPEVLQPRDICRLQCHDGNDFRNAYSTPSRTVGAGNDTAGALTVATVQFPLGGGWNESDLTQYAQRAGLPDPVVTGQYQQFAVDGTTVQPATRKEGGADEEVDLDQETILSTAPFAKQRAYFDSSASKAAYADALSQVFADVTQGRGAMGGGDPKIVALSTSWGACESEFSDRFAFPHDTVKAVGRILDSLTAAGVTIFAASGDDGIYDCGDSSRSTRTAVDYPASAPQVIGVGGTRLRAHGKRSPNNGHNWRDTAWTCNSPRDCQSLHASAGGSGGGQSRLFHRPRYQAIGIGHHRFVTPTGRKGAFSNQRHRLVPDIAVDGDPATGFATLTTDPSVHPNCTPIGGVVPPGCRPAILPIGGTSLSAPAAAALFTDMLAKHGATSGVGDIHAALYSAYAAHHGAFRDVTSGRNGHQPDVDRRAHHKKALEIPVTAQHGFDTVTGLGVPLWPALARYLFDPSPPKPRGSLHLAARHRSSRGREVVAHWGARQDRHNGRAPRSVQVTIARADAPGKTVFAQHHAAVFGVHRFVGKPGKRYVLTVVVRGLGGGHSAPLRRHLGVPRGHG